MLKARYEEVFRCAFRSLPQLYWSLMISSVIELAWTNGQVLAIKASMILKKDVLLGALHRANVVVAGDR